MISYSELTRGSKILFKNQPYEILECAPLFKARGHSVLPSKIKNLINGEIISWTFRPNDKFEEPDILKKDIKFLYSYNNKYIFSEIDNSSKRFELLNDQIGGNYKFLKENEIINGLFFNDKLINIILPIKITLKVIEAAPAVKGQSAQAGTKPVVVEGGAKINTPLFINQGDVIEINTETGEYVRRVN